MAQDFAAFSRKLDQMAKNLDGTARDKILRSLGKAGEKDAMKAVDADVGGTTFSGWPKARFTVNSELSDGGVVVGPSNKGVGVWRVAQDGRHQNMRVLGGGASGPVLGRGNISKKTGKALGKNNKKWNGKTLPKNTWDDAKKIMERETPKRAEKAVLAAVRESFGR